MREEGGEKVTCLHLQNRSLLSGAGCHMGIQQGLFASNFNSPPYGPFFMAS